MRAMRSTHPLPNGSRPNSETPALSTVAKVRLRLRTIVPAFLVALAAFVIGSPLGGVFRKTGADFDVFGWHFRLPRGWVVVIVLALVVIFATAGAMTTRRVGRELDRVSAAKAGIALGAAVRLICSIVGYLTVGLGVLAMLQVNLGNLLVGGAVTGVVLGIAAQQTLGNFFAGLVLLFARPYVPGQRIKVRSGGMGGPFEGVITVTGLLYTTIETDEGPISMPNSGLLGAAVGPAPVGENAAASQLPIM